MLCRVVEEEWEAGVSRAGQRREDYTTTHVERRQDGTACPNPIP